MARTKIDLSPTTLRLGRVKMSRHEREKKWYENRVADLQLQMLRVQQAYHRQKLRAVLVFEGWDAGGKGGTIRRLTEKLDPRGFRVHPIAAPSAVEQGTHYLYRFWGRLPKPGRIAIFDRSWYGRVLVERVDGFAKEREWRRAYDEINELERMLVDDGVRVVKFFMHITADEQLRRFAERLENPYKRWKLTVDDIRNRNNWSAYEKAIEDMFDRTSTTFAPWNLIGGNYKWFARTEVLERAVAALGEGIDLSTPIADPEVVKMARSELGITLDGPLGARARGKDKARSKGKKKNGKSRKAKQNEKDDKSAKHKKTKKQKKDKKAKKGKKPKKAEKAG